MLLGSIKIEWTVLFITSSRGREASAVLASEVPRSPVREEWKSSSMYRGGPLIDHGETNKTKKN